MRFCGTTLGLFFSTLIKSYQAVFVEQVFKAAMSSAGTYDAACNLFWVNFKWSAAPKVPINRDSVKRLQSRMYGKGQPALSSKAPWYASKIQ